MTVRFYESKYYMLSNLSAHSIEFESQLYPTAEHAYQATKFSDPVVVEEIRTAFSPLEAKKIARENFGTSAERPSWKEHKLSTMEKILKAKLVQHQEVREALISTGTQEIIEDSPVDYFWGCGKDGSGESHLGRLWMKLRDNMQL